MALPRSDKEFKRSPQSLQARCKLERQGPCTGVLRAVGNKAGARTTDSTSQEMMMSTASTFAPKRLDTGCLGFMTVFPKTLKSWWVACMTWRVQRIAMAHLRSLSDRQLRDIGLDRSQIGGAVKGGNRIARSLAEASPLDHS
jgi:uncharacterized protein YjiS (DUF1127 family)